MPSTSTALRMVAKAFESAADQVLIEELGGGSGSSRGPAVAPGFRSIPPPPPPPPAGARPETRHGHDGWQADQYDWFVHVLSVVM